MTFDRPDAGNELRINPTLVGLFSLLPLINRSGQINMSTRLRHRVTHWKPRKKGNTPWKWRNPDKRTYTERMVDFDEPLPSSSGQHKAREMSFLLCCGESGCDVIEMDTEAGIYACDKMKEWAYQQFNKNGEFPSMDAQIEQYIIHHERFENISIRAEK